MVVNSTLGRFFTDKVEFYRRKGRNLLPKNASKKGIQPFYNLCEKLTVNFGEGHLVGKKIIQILKLQFGASKKLKNCSINFLKKYFLVLEKSFLVFEL